MKALTILCFSLRSYSLTQTELFLRSILDEEPVKTVVAPEAPRLDHQRAASKEREKVSTNTERERNKHMDFTFVTRVLGWLMYYTS